MSRLAQHTPTATVLPRPRHRAALAVAATPVTRGQVAATLRAIGSRRVVTARTATEARDRTRPVDLVVVEADLPDGSGIDLWRDLHAAGCQTGIVLAASYDPWAARAALAAGVRSYLVCAPPSGPRPARDRADGARGLSDREVEVLQLVADGQSNRVIGEALGLSALTVKSHLARIGQRLGTGDRAELVAVAMRARVVT